MNEKTPDRPSAVIDLGLSHHYVQVLKISVIYHTEIKRHFREDKVWEFLYLINQVTWQTAYVESDVKAKSDVSLDVFLLL